MNQSGLLPAQITQFSPPNKNMAANTKSNTKVNTKANTKANTKVNTKANTKANTKTNNETNTKANNETNTKATNSNKSSANELLNTIKEKIEINRKNLPVWILLLFAIILIILHYVTTPIRYSNERVENVITYNSLYYYLHIGLLVLLCLYGYGVSDRFSPLKGDIMISKGLVIVILVLGVFAINIASAKAIESDETYRTAPKHLYKSKSQQLIILVLLLLILLGIIGYDIFRRKQNPLGLLPYTKLKNLYGIGLLLSVCIVIYILVNGARYNVSRYNLPKMWRS